MKCEKANDHNVSLRWFHFQVHYISNQRIAETGDTSGVMIEYQVRDVWMLVYAALYILTGSACQKRLKLFHFLCFSPGGGDPPQCWSSLSSCSWHGISSWRRDNHEKNNLRDTLTQKFCPPPQTLFRHSKTLTDTILWLSHPPQTLLEQTLLKFPPSQTLLELTFLRFLTLVSPIGTRLADSLDRFQSRFQRHYNHLHKMLNVKSIIITCNKC